MVFVLVGLGAAALVREVRQPVGWATAGVVVAALLAWNLTHLPRAVHADGGFPAGDAAARRVDATLADAGVDRAEVVLLMSLPDFKSTEALAYPLVRLGRAVQAETPDGLAPGSANVGQEPTAIVLMCDRLFRDAIGAECGGPAERRVLADDEHLLDRFEAAPGRWVSVYTPPA
jgi:hypothetical protein